MDFQFGNATGVETMSELELTKDAMGTTVQLELDVSQGWSWWGFDMVAQIENKQLCCVSLRNGFLKQIDVIFI